MTQSAATIEEFEGHRARLIGLGYRMLGTRAEAEDLVQETYLRWHRTPRDQIRQVGPWLHTTMARLCVDALRSRKVRLEQYIGPWLPEPWLTPAPVANEAEQRLELADDLSVAFLLLLERLAPEERAAFLLHDVFEAGYPEIAATLEKSEAAVRQIVSRARGRIADERPRFHASRRDQEAMAERFRQAVTSRDETALLALFRPDATLVSDGGGKAMAALRPIYGADKIVRFFMGITRHTDPASLALEPCWINNAAGMVIRHADGSVMATFAMVVANGRIANVYAVRNPDKLSRLGQSPGSGRVRP
jgi:RNA polymerase sigma-70 factor (ECF subfamily)